MSPLGWVVLIALVLYGVAALYGGVRIGLRLGGGELPLVTRAPARAARPGKDPAPGKDLTWLRTAVYLYSDRHGALLYVGIAANPGKRARQHAGLESAPMKDWWPQVDPSRTQAWWFPNRIAACCVEWALIHYLNPPWNTAPGSSDDAYCLDQPPIVEARFEVPSPTPARLRRVVGLDPRAPHPRAPRRPFRVAPAPRRPVHDALEADVIEGEVLDDDAELDGADAWGPW